jgi:hypothetical protein
MISISLRRRITTTIDPHWFWDLTKQYVLWEILPHTHTLNGTLGVTSTNNPTKKTIKHKNTIGPTCTRDSSCNVGRAPNRPPVEPKHKNRWEWSGGPKTQLKLTLDRLGPEPAKAAGPTVWWGREEAHSLQGDQLMRPPLTGVRCWWVPTLVSEGMMGLTKQSAPCTHPAQLRSAGPTAYRQTPHYPHSPHYLR